jgi:uncharacterized membrane protein
MDVHSVQPLSAANHVPRDRFGLASLVAVAGTLHFTHAETFASMVPDYLPAPMVLVWLSGVAEIALGMFLLQKGTRVFAAYGLIALFVAVFPANVGMALHPERGLAGVPVALPPLLLWLRLPLQLVLIAWAYRHARAPR